MAVTVGEASILAQPYFAMCAFTEFVGRKRERRVCRSLDRVLPVQVCDGPVLFQDLCHEHRIPYLYEKSFEEAMDEDLLASVAQTDPRVAEMKRLRSQARQERWLFSQDRRRRRHLEEADDLMARADALLGDILAESNGEMERAT